MSTSTEFEAQIDPFRRELLAHCYRMLGSVHDAEDLVQETMLRAWRAHDQFDERRASLRTWLYRIATNACLTELVSRKRRPLPSGLGGPSDDPTGPLVRGQEVPWLQPFPDAAFDDGGGDPAGRLASRENLRLALVAAMQLLPARQRAILILRDVLGFSAAEVAAILDSTTAAVNSGLQRAKARLAGIENLDDQSAEVSEATDPDRQAQISRYIAAFERADVSALKQMLTDDVVLEMPPVLNWFVGSEHYARFIANIFAIRGTDWRMIPTSANGQPAVGAYVRCEDGAYHAHTLQVFTVTSAGISHNVVFQDTALFDLFGLPARLDADTVTVAGLKVMASSNQP